MLCMQWWCMNFRNHYKYTRRKKHLGIQKCQCTSFTNITFYVMYTFTVDFQFHNKKVITCTAPPCHICARGLPSPLLSVIQCIKPGISSNVDHTSKSKSALDLSLRVRAGQLLNILLSGIKHLLAGVLYISCFTNTLYLSEP